MVNEILSIHPVTRLMFPLQVNASMALRGFAVHPGDVLLVRIQPKHERNDLYPDPLSFNPNCFLNRSFGIHELIGLRAPGAALVRFKPFTKRS